MIPGRMVVLVLAIGGCNGGALPVEIVDGGTIDAGFASYVAYEAAVWNAFCAELARCGSLGASECGLPPDPASLHGPVDYDALLAAGHMAFDQASAAACVAWWRNHPCGNNGTNYGRVCQQVLRGLLTTGSACVLDDECANGYCAGSKTRGCPGACAPYAAEGVACGTVPCAPLIDYCDSSCRPFGAAGEPCAPLAVDCQDGLACIPGAKGGTSCAVPGAIGAACVVESCQSGSYCDSATMTCKAALGEGAACTRLEMCQDGFDCVGLRRDGTSSIGHCARWADLGGACVPSDTMDTGCPSEMSCDSMTATCVRNRQPPGTPCTMDSQCVTGCDPAKKTCVEASGVGDPCKPPLPGANNPCDWGTCDPVTQTCRLSC